jgi:futalosine hydrolase
VGKANAAGATAAALARGGFGGALSLGIGGALPGSGLATRDVVVADESVLADEGLETGEGFVDLRAMGFGPAPDGGMGVASDPGVADALVAGLGATRGVVATVSICSGTDARAEWVRSRTGAVVEAMEGAAVGLSARSMGGAIAFAEVRVVSNTTGDRGGQAWDLEGALGRLEAVARSM